MTLASLVARYGTLTIGTCVALEGMGLPLPGEVVLLTGAALAAAEGDPLIPVIAAAWIGTLLGGTGGYWIGLRGGDAVIRLLRRGGLSPAREERARALFDRHGAKTIIIARFVAVLRIAAGIFAGVARMPFGVFSLCNAIGGLVWSLAIATIGYEFGANLPTVERWLRRSSVLVGSLIILIIICAILVKRRRRK